MPKPTYLNCDFFDVQRRRYKVVEEIVSGKISVRLKTGDRKLIVILQSLDDKKDMENRLEWVKSLGDKDAVLSNAIAMPSSLLTGLKRDEVGYVCEPSGECTLNHYINPEKGERLFKWYYEKTGGIDFRLKIAFRIADRLQQIHARGVSLVDVCPENTTLQIFEGDSQSPPNIQFLGADSVSSCAYHAQSTGSPRYGDPLVLQYRSAPSPTSDTFSLAVMLFEMITTCHPFFGEEAVLLSNDEFYEELKQGSLDYIGDENSLGNKNELFEDTRLFLSEELTSLFARMFVSGKLDASARPTLNDLKSACLQSLKRIVKCDHKSCEKDYPYNPELICPFCNRPTSHAILARLRKDVVASSKMLLPHDGIDGFSGLPLLTEDQNLMVIRPGLNKMTRSFFGPFAKFERDATCIIVNYSPDENRLRIENHFTAFSIKVSGKELVPHGKAGNGRHSSIDIPADNGTIIELPVNAQIEPERIVPIEDNGYGVVRYKWVISME